MEGLPKLVDASYLNFIYKKCSMSYECMTAWLSIPEFVDKVTCLYQQGADINDSVILPIAERILEEKKLNRKVNKDFPFQNARRGINQVRRALDINS